MEWISETSLLYFFSTLAQCAAGFAALIGVFAVFRLQANAPVIVEEYTAARNWLRRVCTISDTDSLPKYEVKNKLQRIERGELKLAPPESAKNILIKINKAEKFDGKLVYQASLPLKLWAYIFLFSIGIILHYFACKIIYRTSWLFCVFDFPCFSSLRFIFY